MAIETSSSATVAQSFYDHRAISWLVVLALFTVLVVTLRQLFLLQPSQVIVDSQGLNSYEYQQLNHVISADTKENALFFSARLTDILTEVTGLGWVSEASVYRDWERGIVVKVLPKEAVARFGSEHLIDADGQVFQPANPIDLKRKGLILLQGEPHQAKLIMQQMQQINQWFLPLDMQVTDLILTPRMTWLIRFDNGLRIVVDKERSNQKLMNVSQMLQTQLAGKSKEMASIDLRYQNGFAISWKTLANKPNNAVVE